MHHNYQDKMEWIMKTFFHIFVQNWTTQQNKKAEFIETQVTKQFIQISW